MFEVGDGVFSGSGDYGKVRKVVDGGYLIVWADGYDDDAHAVYTEDELVPEAEWKGQAIVPQEETEPNG